MTFHIYTHSRKACGVHIFWIGLALLRGTTLVDMDDCTHILNPRDNVHHYYNKNKSTLDNSPPPNYDKESKDECHHVNNNPRYKWYVK